MSARGATWGKGRQTRGMDAEGMLYEQERRGKQLERGMSRARYREGDVLDQSMGWNWEWVSVEGLDIRREGDRDWRPDDRERME